MALGFPSMKDEPPYTSLRAYWLRILRTIDIPAIVGVLLIILFGLWFVRHYALSIS
jgi:hypothetical protein